MRSLTRKVTTAVLSTLQVAGIVIWMFGRWLWKSRIIEKSGALAIPVAFVLIIVGMIFGDNTSTIETEMTIEQELIQIENPPEVTPTTKLKREPIERVELITEAELEAEPEAVDIPTTDTENGIWVSSDGKFSFIYNTLENSRYTGLYNGIPFTVDVLDTVYAEWSKEKYVIKPDFDNLLSIFIRETGGDPNLYGRDTNGFLSAGLIQCNNYDNTLWYTNNNTEITGFKPVAIYREQTIAYPTESQAKLALLYYPDGLDPFNVQQLTEYYLTRYQAVGEYYGWSQAKLLAANGWGVGGAKRASQDAVDRHHRNLRTTQAEWIGCWEF